MSLGTINLNEKQRRRLPRFTPSLFVVSPSRSIGQSPSQYLSLWQLFESELCLLPFLFREALLCHSNSRSAAQHTLMLRLEWQDERRSFCFPPPVGAPFIAAASRARGPEYMSGHSHGAHVGDF